MTLKYRVEKAEKEVVPRQETKLWIIRDSFNATKEDPEGKQRIEEKIKKITDGKIKNRDGTYYRPGDTFFIISEIFRPKFEGKERPAAKALLDPKESQGDKERPPSKEDKSIRKRIEDLKKRKAKLEKKIKEKSK